MLEKSFQICIMQSMKREYQILVGAALVLGLVVLAMNVDFGHTEGTHQEHMDETHQVSIKSERDFLAHMIVHHEEAVVAAQSLLDSGITDPVLVELAESIVRDQASEVAQMRSWYEEWFGAAFVPGEYHAMMRPQNGLTPAEQKRVFLEDMIVHHEAALEATRQLLLITDRPELTILAGDIISSQAAEIALMQQLLE